MVEDGKFQGERCLVYLMIKYKRTYLTRIFEAWLPKFS